MTNYVYAGAKISANGMYRYELERLWDSSKRAVAWCMLNPSTADGETDDATIRKVIGFSQRWGYGGIVVVNLFALRARNPRRLVDHFNPEGIENGDYLRSAASAYPLIMAWGTSIPRQYLDYARDLANELRGDTIGLTRSGEPRHPLYAPYTAERTPWPVS